MLLLKYHDGRGGIRENQVHPRQGGVFHDLGQGQRLFERSMDHTRGIGHKLLSDPELAW